MRILLDTNIFLYMSTKTDLLDNEVYELLHDYDNQLYISIESIREMVYLFNVKRLGYKIWHSAKEIVDAVENRFDLGIIPLKREHVLTYAGLRLNRNHGDPSDHMIISQAITEHLSLISSDRKFSYYQSQGLDFIYNRK